MTGIYNFLGSAVQNLKPTQIAANLVEGGTQKATEMLKEGQPEFTELVRYTISNALIRTAPFQLLESIQAFKQNPSIDGLNAVKTRAKELDYPQLRRTWPGFESRLNVLAALAPRLEAMPPLAIPPSNEISEALSNAEDVLTALKDNQGALIQLQSVISQSVTDPNGSIEVLRRKLNDPQDGIFPQCMATLRSNLNSTVHPPLRASKNALEAYSDALGRNANPNALLSLLQALDSKLQLLLAQKERVPQYNPADWANLEDFRTAVQNLIALPPQENHAQLLEQATPPLEILRRGFKAQNGIIEEATDILVNGIERGTEPLAALPRRMLESWNSPAATPILPAPQAAPLPTAPAAAPAPQANPLAPPAHQAASLNMPSFLDFGALLSQGRSILNTISQHAGTAVSQNAASGLSALIGLAFTEIRRRIPTENSHVITTLTPIITRLQHARNQSSWGELYAALEDAFGFMQNQQVYFQALRLPIGPERNHSSVIPTLLQTISEHENALRPADQRILPQVTPADIQRQTELLESRIAAYGPASMALKLCGVQEDTWYSQVLKVEDPTRADLPSCFREQLFTKIANSNANFLWKWLAKGTYSLFMPLSSFYTRSIIGGIIAHAEEWTRRTPDPEHPKEELIINMMRAWLATTSATFDSAAKASPTQVTDLKVMLEKEINNPERNNGMTRNRLVSATLTTLLDTFGPRIKWDETIVNYFSNRIPSNSPLHFLDPILQVLNGFSSFCLRAIVFIPQWIGNQFLQKAAKIALKYLPFEEYTDRKIEELRHNTPSSYAMQQLIYRQLQKVLENLRQNLNDDSESANLPHFCTETIKDKISGLVGYLNEVLDKSKYPTQNGLQRFVQSRAEASLRDRLEREVDDAALPEIIDTAVKIIALTLETVTQEGELQQLLYDALNIANSSFDQQPTIPPQNYAVLQRGIQESTDELLQAAIHYGTQGLFDFANERQRTGVASFLNELKEQTTLLTVELNEGAREVLQDSLNASEYQNKISGMIEKSMQYLNEKVNLLGRADGNRNFHAETKFHLNEICRDSLQYCSPISEHLNAMKGKSDEMVGHEKILQLLASSQTLNSELLQKFQAAQLSDQDLVDCRLKLTLLRNQIEELRRNQFPPLQISALETSHQNFTEALNRFEMLQTTNRLMALIPAQFEILKSAKLKSPSRALRDLEKQFCTSRIIPLPNTEQRARLSTRILTLMQANMTDVEAAANLFTQEYTQLHEQNLADTHDRKRFLQQTAQELEQNLTSYVQEFADLRLQSKSAIQRHVTEIQSKSEALNQWGQDQNGPAIWDLFLFDMQWIPQTINGIAFNRAKSKFDQLLRSLRDRHSYFGFLNQVCHSFLESFGKK